MHQQLCVSCLCTSIWVQVYYYNTSTGESSWQKPEGFEGNTAAGKGTPTPASSEGIPLTGWSEVTCTDGRKYYYHAEREVSAAF